MLQVCLISGFSSLVRIGQVKWDDCATVIVCLKFFQVA